MPDLLDARTWTPEFVRRNENECSDKLLSTLNVAKQFTSECDYEMAVQAFFSVTYGLTLLLQIDEEYYSAPLYANYYALSKIYAFGLHDVQKAQNVLQMACNTALKCSSPKARKDYFTMNEILKDFKAGRPLRAIQEEFGTMFPYDIING